MTEVSAFLGAQPRAGPPRDVSKPPRGLNDISVLSKSCHGRNLGLSEAVIWNVGVDRVTASSNCPSRQLELTQRRLP